MKKLLLFAFAFISILRLTAQECATDEYDVYLKRTNPQYATEQLKMEQQIYSILKNKQNNPNARIIQNGCQQPSAVFTIPIVVHVIHKGEAIGTGFNISDAQIIDAVRGMNERWRRIQGDGVDLEIQFELAVRDTNNNATNGITRYDGRIFPNYTANGIYSGGAPGASAVSIMDSTVWDRSKYINIWVVDLRNACGFASLGIAYSFFMDYNCMYYNSITLAHEMGHAFGLHHTFAGDGSGGGLGSSTQCPANNDCLLDGDWVCDTPPHKKAECSTTSCTTSGDLQNSFKNFMSYCGTLVRFTQGQKDRVRTFLYSDNFWSLVMSDALTPVTTPLEVGIVSIENNLDKPVCNGFIPMIRIKNRGNATITTLKVDTYIDGSFYQATTINTNLIKNNAIIYSLQSLNFNSAGKHSLTFTITEINGSTSDYQPLDNQICKDILVRNNSVNSLCLNIENNTYNSILEEIDTTFNPQLVTVNGCNSIGDKAIRIDFFNTSQSYINKRFYLPAINLDSVYSSYLIFEHSYKQGKVASLIDLQFYITECDGTSKYLGYFNINSLASVTGRDSLNPWIPTSCDQWKKDSVAISNYRGKSNLSIEVMYQNYGYQGSQNLYLDNFCIHKRYRILATVNPISTGSITYSNSGGIYDDGSIATITANSNYCKAFKNWTENGVVVSTNASYTFTVNRNRNLIANFERAQYTIALSPDNIANGTIVGNGIYNCDTVITVKASPTSCYNFVKWTENGVTVSTNSNYTFTVTANRNLTANFTKKQYLISLSSNDINKGTVTGGGSYGCDTTVVIKANIKTGGSWQNWTENGTIVSTDSIYSFIVSTNRTLVANFIAAKYKISVSTNIPYAISQGWVDTTTNYYNYGSTVQMFAQECCCYKFVNWTENGIIVSTAFNYSFIATQSRDLVANYEIKQRSIFAKVNDSTKGFVLGNGIYDCGSNITLQAHVKQGGKWLYWTYYGNQFSGGNDSILTLTVANSNDSNYVANFTTVTYSIATSSNIANAGTLTGGGAISYGTTISVAATAASCYTFKNWTENGAIVSTNANYTFTVSTNRNLVANFEMKRFAIAVSSDNIDNGTATGNGTYGCDTITTVTATAASCYTFKNWTENGAIVSTNANYTFTVSTNRNLVANFELKRYNIILAANPTNGGTVSNGGNFACDSSITVKASAKTGYKFLNWMEGSTIVSTDSNYTFLISSARSLKANFGLATGIKQTSINEISKIYPNPVNDILQLEIHSKQNSTLTLNIIDMKGSLLETKNITNTKGILNTSFDVSKLAKGNYILNLYDEEGMASYKFVVQ